MRSKTPNQTQRNEASKKTAQKGSPFNGRAMLAQLETGRASMNAAENETVFRQGDPADAVFYVDRGAVKLTVVSDQGKEGVIAMLGAGDFFGEGCLAGQEVQLATAVATADSDIVKVEKGAMIRLLHDDQQFSEMFTAFLLSRNIQIEADLIDQLFNSSEKRLARTLLLLANFGKEGAMQPVIPKVTHELLAARVGTTRSRISFFMNKFRKHGLIEYNGTLKVHSALLNVIIHD